MKEAFRVEEVRTEQLDITGSIFGVSLISGGTLNQNAVSGTFGRLGTTDGAVFPIVRQSGTSPTFGARINFGSAVTGAEGFGSVIFNTPFANTQYFFTAQIGSASTFLSVDAGSWNIAISGPLGKNISGVVFKGGPSTRYDWVAIGL